MNLSRIYLIVILLLALGVGANGQEFDEESNWYKEIGRDDDYYTRFDFNRYTKADVLNAKQRYKTISSNITKGDWYGIYSSGVEIGSNELHWNPFGGFVYFYVYHTLGSLDYGSIVEDADSLVMHSEKTDQKSSQKYLKNRLIKVVFGEARFLVPEKRLSDFLERAAGLSTSISDYGYYWQKDVEKEPKLFGVPIVPEKYRKLVRSPIKSKITGIGRRVVHQNKFDDGTVNYEEVYRYLTLHAGSKQGLRVGMNLYADQLGEWVEVTDVRANGSTGRIRRGFHDGKEECLDEELGQGMQIPCKQVKVGAHVRTKRSESYF